MIASARWVCSRGGAGQRSRAVLAAVGSGLLAAGLAVTPATGGVVFREAETIEGTAPGNGSRQIRQVLAEDEACKVVLEDGGDTLLPIGAYVLATTVDAFLVDPAERTIAPLDPTTMVPAATTAEPTTRAPVTDVALDLLFDAPGPVLLGLPTRHLVWRLRYRDGASAQATLREERHELWVTPWVPGEALPTAWLKLRIAEDAGLGPERADLRDAVEQMYTQGFVLQQVIERVAPAGSGEAAGPRVLREVMSFSREPVPATAFEQPQGYSATEFLAPPADDPPTMSAPRPDGT